MASAKEILTAVDAIAAFYKPLTILLFGSYAYGSPNYDSDVDLLVLKNFHGSQNKQYNNVCEKLRVNFALDLLVRRPDVVRRRIEGNDFFLQEVMEKGIVLYACDNTRMGAKGRIRLRRRLASVEISQIEPVRPDLLSLPAMR